MLRDPKTEIFLCSDCQVQVEPRIHDYDGGPDGDECPQCKKRLPYYGRVNTLEMENEYVEGRKRCLPMARALSGTGVGTVHLVGPPLKPPCCDFRSIRFNRLFLELSR